MAEDAGVEWSLHKTRNLLWLVRYKCIHSPCAPVAREVQAIASSLARPVSGVYLTHMDMEGQTAFIAIE